MIDRDDIADDYLRMPSQPRRRESGVGADRRTQFRYGAVFLLTLAGVVFVIAAPSADWSRAVTLALEGAALVVAV